MCWFLRNGCESEGHCGGGFDFGHFLEELTWFGKLMFVLLIVRVVHVFGGRRWR